MAELPTSIKSGTICLMGVEIEVHALDNGERIITAESLQLFMEALENGSIDPGNVQGIEEYARFMRGEL